MWRTGFAEGSAGRASSSSTPSQQAPSPTTAFTSSRSTPGSGLLRTGVVDEPLRILDQCRVTPAVVESVDGDVVQVLARPLLWDGRRLRLGAPEARIARWRDDGLGFVHEPRPGDDVSLHWDFVCDVLSPAAAHALGRATRRALHAVNASTAGQAALS